MAKINEPLVKVTQEGLQVISKQVSEKLAKKKLSASTISGLQGCPASWLSNSFVIPEIVESEPDNAARRGSMFHQVMENFFALPAEERTHESMRQEVKNVLASDEYKDLAEIRDAVLWLRGAVNGYYNMKADSDPSEVVIAEIETTSKNGRGSALAEVLELLEASESDSSISVKEAIAEVLAKKEYYRLSSNPDAFKWIKKSAKSVLKLQEDHGADSEEAVAAKNSLIFKGNREIKSGLEIFVIGRIGNAKRDTLGFIDRVQELDRETESDVSSKVKVEDWKSGAKAKAYNPKTRAKNPPGLSEQRQQIVYSILLEQEHGVKVESARLIYPVAREVVEVDLTDEKLRARVIEDVEAADKQLDNHIERNLFEYSPSILCSWCPLARICPSAKSFNHVEKARLAMESQPSTEVLAQGFEFTRRR